MARVVLALLALVLAISANKSLPDKFYGTFDLDHSENFDEYLTAKGYGWFTRKLVTFATFKKEFKKGTNGKFDYANLTSKKNVHYNDIALGQEFIGEGLDSTKHKVTFDLLDGVLFEKHVPTEKSGEAKEETYEYSFVNKNGKEYLLTKMEANGVVGKRFYKRL